MLVAGRRKPFSSLSLFPDTATLSATWRCPFQGLLLKACLKMLLLLRRKGGLQFLLYYRANYKKFKLKQRFQQVSLLSRLLNINMILKQIEIRYFPPGLNLQIRQPNNKSTTKEINLYGMNLIQKIQDLNNFIQQSIYSHEEYAFLNNYQKQITQAIEKIYAKNNEKHARKYSSQFVLKAHKQPLTRCRFSKYGQLFATSSYDRTCKLWDSETGVLLNTLSGHQNAIFSIDISENNNRRLIATGSLDKTTKIWSVTGKRFHSLVGHDGEVTKVEFNPNGQYVLTSALDGLIKVWDLQKGRCFMDLKGQENGIVTFEHNYQGDQVICCGFNNIPLVFDLKSGQVIHELQGHHEGQVTCCKFDFTGEVCATAGTDKKCVVWDIGMNEAMEVFEDHEEEILDLDFNPMGNKLATCSADSTVCVYNANIGTLENKLKGHEREVTKVKFSSQGDFLLSTGFDGIARIWNSETGENIDVLEGHSDEIFSSDISYYGDKIITCSKDSSSILWKEVKNV